MSARELDFAALIAPVTPGTFFAEYWEKQPLVVSSDDSHRYAALFGSSDIDALIHFGRASFREADSASGARNPTVLRGLPPEAHEAGTRPVQLGLLKLRRLYAEGKTILVHSLQRSVPAVAALCRNLEQALECPVNVNVYLTPPGAQGFAAHVDDYDVFICQLEGSKHWRLYKPLRELPLKFETVVVPEKQLTGPIDELRLEAGDLLYLPRGTPHEAFTSDRTSLHLTIGAEFFRWADLLASAIVNISQREVALRRAVPIGWLGANRGLAGMQDQFREVLRLVTERADLSAALADLAAQFIGGLSALPDGRFAEELEPENLGLDTLLAKRAGTICHVIEQADRISIQFPGNHITCPRTVSSALHFLQAASGPFTARALPNDLTDNSKLILLRRLVKEGFLTFVCDREGA